MDQVAGKHNHHQHQHLHLLHLLLHRATSGTGHEEGFENNSKQPLRGADGPRAWASQPRQEMDSAPTWPSQRRMDSSGSTSCTWRAAVEKRRGEDRTGQDRVRLVPYTTVTHPRSLETSTSLARPAVCAGPPGCPDSPNSTTICCQRPPFPQELGAWLSVPVRASRPAQANQMHPRHPSPGRRRTAHLPPLCMSILRSYCCDGCA